TKAMRQVAGRLRLDLAQYRELAAFSQFASELDPSTRARLTRGERLIEVLKQPQYQPMSWPEQVIAIYAAVHGLMDDLPVTKIIDFEAHLLRMIKQGHPEIFAKLEQAKALDESLERDLDEVVKTAKQSFPGSEQGMTNHG
ncbi:MAG: F0F1 ATP synthase subunit alpha, partial [Bacillota bacterium]